MLKLEKIKEKAKSLRLKNTEENIESLIKEAEIKEISYQEFIYNLLENELKLRDEKAKERRVKDAGFPMYKDLSEFDFNFQKSIDKKQMNRLKELDWIDQMYNLIFLGPPGVGKTHIALSLGYEAVENGYKVSFCSMDGLIHILKTKEIARKSKTKYNKIIASHLVIIDELGYLPITREEANLFFQLISALHEQASIIITSNKGFEDWAELLGDVALTTAILDRITYKCELFNMTGKSYRLEHRKTLF